MSAGHLPVRAGADVGGTVADRLFDDIVHGRIVAGSPLPEPVLCERYGASRTPVREALVRLEAQGLVVRASRGYRVRSGSASDILDLYEVRIALESLAARGAALRHTPLELTRLRVVNDEALAADDPAVAQARHSEWHRVLWAAAHNASVTAMLDGVSHQLRVLDHGNVRGHGDFGTTNDEHGAVIDAIARRDEDAAAAALSAHLTRTREERLQHFAALERF